MECFMTYSFLRKVAVFVSISLAAWSTNAAVAMSAPQKQRNALRVCANPNNLPFSNNKGEGFENKLAEMIAKDLGRKVEYTWLAQRRSFFPTLKAGSCDLMMGVPSGFDMALTTAPYYRSTYVFVTRASQHLSLQSLDDPRLHELRVGVQMIGDNFSNIPPAYALSERGIIQNVKAYTRYSDYSQPNPPARIIEAVAKNEIDVGVVWGPLAGYLSKHSSVPLSLSPVTPQIDRPFLPFVFDISIGVRRDNAPLKDKLERVLEDRRSEIEKLLDDYGVPRVNEAEGDSTQVGD